MSTVGQGRRSVFAALCLAAICLAASSCRSRPLNDRRPPNVKDQTSPATYSLSVRGAVRAAFEQDGVPVRTLSLLDDRLPTVTMFSVSPEKPVAGPGGARLLGSFELVGYKGDGTYTIGTNTVSAASPGTNPAAVSKGLSQARLVYTDASGSARVFDDPLEPCTIEIRKGGSSGTMTCTSLADAAGKTVSVQMTWQR